MPKIFTGKASTVFGLGYYKGKLNKEAKDEEKRRYEEELGFKKKQHEDELALKKRQLDLQEKESGGKVLKTPEMIRNISTSKYVNEKGEVVDTGRKLSERTKTANRSSKEALRNKMKQYGKRYS